VPDIAQLLSIDIGIDPILAEFGGLELTWHGIFTAVGIALGVYLGVWLGRQQGFTEDDGYSIALVGVPAGIVGARAMFVLENRERFEGQWFDVMRINEGGISIYGAVIGGVLGAVIYGWLRRMPVARGLDVAAFGLLLGMAVGRIGDLINGEHISKSSDLPWAVRYTHIDSPSFQLGAQHPATTYELLGDLLIIGLLVLLFRQFWRTRPGVTFFAGLVLYSAMRFGVSYLRLDSCVEPSGGCPDYIIRDWMTFPQVVSLCTFAIGAAGLAWFAPGSRSSTWVLREDESASPGAKAQAARRA
jgi:prolipoprotein diacylglyceryl transferase